MEPLSIRVPSAIVESIVAGVAIGALLILVRRIQLALGVKENKSEGRPHVTGV